MSYPTCTRTNTMFGRFSEGIRRIAEEEDVRELFEDDIHTLANALGLILTRLDYDKATIHAAEYVSCETGGMAEVFQELPDVKDHLINTLMENEGYSYMDNEWLTMWVKKED